MKDTAKNEGYKFVKYLGNKLALFQDIYNNNHSEIWVSNKNHASFGFYYNNTEWEFISDYKE